jgi:hypothetical protein
VPDLDISVVLEVTGLDTLFHPDGVHPDRVHPDGRIEG